MEILKTFGVEPILLLAQIVNFVILIFILQRFLYKPILRVLEERKNKIATSLKQAEEIQKRFEESTTKQEEILDQARKEATTFIQTAKEEAKLLSDQLQNETKKSIDETVKRTQQSLELDNQKMILEARNQIVEMVAIATEKVVGKALKDSDKERLIQKAIKDIKNEN
ncbi:MAG: F0F1 ATP synthase subunit B [bacterium]|nr:F0F1 ATP synthase subunit B [bacterium]